MIRSGKAVVLTILLSFLPLKAVAADEAGNPWFQKLLSQQRLVIEGVPILAEQTILEVYSDNGFRPMWNRANVEDLMRLIDEEYLRHPFYGTRKMRDCLQRQGYPVNRKRVRRLINPGMRCVLPLSRGRTAVHIVLALSLFAGAAFYRFPKRDLPAPS